MAKALESIAIFIKQRAHGMFESLSRTATCTGELSALICVIPRGKDLIPPC